MIVDSFGNLVALSLGNEKATMFCFGDAKRNGVIQVFGFSVDVIMICRFPGKRADDEQAKPVGFGCFIFFAVFCFQIFDEIGGNWEV